MVVIILCVRVIPLGLNTMLASFWQSHAKGGVDLDFLGARVTPIIYLGYQGLIRHKDQRDRAVSS